MSVIFAYVTTSDREEALRIGRKLVEERLAACVNVLDGMHSVYQWQGRVEESKECVLLVKSRAVLVDAVIQRIKQLHSYSCPCVAILPVSGGNPEYLDWIREETGDT